MKSKNTNKITMKSIMATGIEAAAMAFDVS
jgi:hypothetical protein